MLFYCAIFLTPEGESITFSEGDKVQNRWVQEIFRFIQFMLALLIGFTLGTIVFRWAPYLPILKNPYEIDSPLVRQNIDPINNILRFGFLLLSPALVWAFLDRLCRRFRSNQFWQDNDSDSRHSNQIYFVAQLFILALGISYLTRSFTLIEYKMDSYYFFHEGEWLAPAWKWYSEKKLWLGSFFAHGAFYDALSSALAWKIFGHVSIGASRLFTGFLENLIYPLAFLCILLSVRIAFSEKKSQALQSSFVLLATSSYFIGTYINWHNFERRDFLVLLGFPFLLYGLCKKNSAAFFLASLFAWASWFYSIDRGAYFTFVVLFVPACIAALTREWKQLFWEYLLAVCSGIFCFCLFWIFFGKEEMLAGLHATKFLLQIKDLSDGSIYPAPGFPITNLKFLLSRHTVPLLNLCVQFLFFSIFLFRNKFRLKRESQWIVEISLLIIALIYYRGALSRCDEVHYRYVASFGFIGAAFCVSRAITNSVLWKLNSLRYVFILLAAFIPIQKISENSSNGLATLRNLKQVQNYIQKPDSEFLLDWEQSTLAFLNQEFKDEPCLYSMVSEPLWPYLMRKNSCGRFHIMWFISDRRLQMEAIKELAEYSPNKILMHTPRSGDEMDGIAIEDRAKYLYKFISERYEPYREKDGWEMWKKKR